MKKLLFILTLIISLPLGVSAQYIVHDFAGNVTIEKLGKGEPSAVSKGMPVAGSDYLNIPSDGFVELQSTDGKSQLYRSVSSGRFTPSRIAMDARLQASDNSRAINDNIRTVAGTKKKQKVYDQTGMVTRSLVALDPKVAAMNINAENLCQTLASAIRNSDYLSRSEMPVSLTTAATEQGGTKVELRSMYPYPVYFNIFRVKPGQARVEVSELGQDIGNYMLGSNQAIARENTMPLEEGYTHIILMTPAPFNLNGLLKDVEEMLSKTDIATPPADLPVYIKAL